MSLILILICLVVLLLTGLPIFAGLGLVSIILLFVTEGQISSLGEIVFGKLNIYLLVAIPMFAFMAHVMIKSQAIDDLFKTAHTLVRHLPGGLGVATVLSCTVFAAISGSSVATALTIGSTAIPQMKKFGYKLRDTYGVVAAGGTLGILIPPSGPLILYGVVSETSIGALFIAGLLPGLLLAFVFALYCVLTNLNTKGSKKQERAGITEIVRSLKKSFWALLLPPIVLGGMYFGIFTATEAAGVGAIAALLIATFVYKNFSWQDLFDSAKETTQLTAMLFMILASAAIFGHVLTVMGLPSELVSTVTQAGVGSIAFILLTMGVIFILGMFLETIAIILVTTPIILPVLESLSINPVWYGILLMINLELALITPPVGMNLFVIKGIAKAPMEDIIFGILPYVLLMLLGLIVVLIFPQLALWLPTTMGYGL